MNMQTWVSKFKMAAHVGGCVECVMSHVMADQKKNLNKSELVLFSTAILLLNHMISLKKNSK